MAEATTPSAGKAEAATAAAERSGPISAAAWVVLFQGLVFLVAGALASLGFLAMLADLVLSLAFRLLRAAGVDAHPPDVLPTFSIATLDTFVVLLVVGIVLLLLGRYAVNLARTVQTGDPEAAASSLASAVNLQWAFLALGAIVLFWTA